MIFLFLLLLGLLYMNMEVISVQGAIIFNLFGQNLTILKYGTGRFLWIWCLQAPC